MFRGLSEHRWAVCTSMYLQSAEAAMESWGVVGVISPSEIRKAMFPQAAPFFPAPLHETIPAVPPLPMLPRERPFGNVGTTPVMVKTMH